MEEKIKIIKNGPYVVSGNIPLDELIIRPTTNGYTYVDAKKFISNEQYSLCRCGKSKNAPFCDGSHIKELFDGTCNSNQNIDEPLYYNGTTIDFKDIESLCASARLCYTKKSDIWNLIKEEGNEKTIKTMTFECPSGRLILIDKSNNEIEPKLKKELSILQDEERNCSGPIWVKGNVKLISENNIEYQNRNRITLCRCGKSKNKPFCDGTHVFINYKDK